MKYSWTKGFPSRTTSSRTKKWQNIAKTPTWNSARLAFVKKTGMPTTAKSVGYIKYCSSSSPRPTESPRSSTRYNCQKICSWLRRPGTIQEIRKKDTFLEVVNKTIIYKFFQDFTNHRKKTNRAVVFSAKPFPNTFKYKTHRLDIPTLWKARFLWVPSNNCEKTHGKYVQWIKQMFSE